MLFVVSDGKVLLSRRLNTWFGNGQFAPPGGMVDGGETPEEAAVREAAEEANIKILDEDVRLFAESETVSNERTFHNYYFVAEKWSGEVKNNEPHRHNELDWYDIENLPTVTMPLVKELIAKL